MSNTFLQSIPAIRNLILDKKYLEAFRQLRFFIEYPAKEIQADEDLVQALELFIHIAKGLQSETLPQLAEDVIKDLNNPQKLYDLAYQLYEAQVYGFAATILKRASLFIPESERIITELVVNLEHVGLNEEAVTILLNCKELLELSFFCNYLLSFNSILSGKHEEAKKAYQKAAELHDRNSNDQKSMVNRLKLFLDRIDALAAVSRLENSHLRLWHFIINGSIILYRSPHGLKEGMNGRFAFVQDSANMIHTGIQLLKQTLAELKIKPEHVLYVKNNKSETLAKALAKELGLTALLLEESNKDTKGIVAVYDLKELNENEYKMLGTVREGQYIWVQAASWTEEDTYNPDFVTFVYQQNISPWEEQMSYTSDHVEQKKALFNENIEDTIKQIEANGLEDQKDQLESIKRFTTLLNDAFKNKEVFTYLNNVRQRKWRGSPVKSSYFM